MKRIFLAINMPPEVKGALYGIQDDLKEVFKYSKVTWVDPEIAHITLHFIGDVEDEDIPELIERLGAGEYPEAFELELHGFSCFPDPKRPKTLCVETSNHTAATGLYLRIGKILVENGFDVDERPWVPHITLGRVRMQSETCPTDGITIPEIKFEVTSFELMESELTGDGPVYTVLDSIAL